MQHFIYRQHLTLHSSEFMGTCFEFCLLIGRGSFLYNSPMLMKKICLPIYSLSLSLAALQGTGSNGS